jgi:hypothetical protein
MDNKPIQSIMPKINFVKVNPAVVPQPQSANVSSVVSPVVTQKQIEDRKAIAWHDGTRMHGLKRWHIIQHPFENPDKDYFQFFSNTPPKAAHIVSSQGHAFQMARNTFGKIPSKEIVNVLPDSAARLGTDTSLPHLSPQITRKAHITHHGNPLKDSQDGGIPKMGQIFPLR